jgi:hypothetical protein
VVGGDDVFVLITEIGRANVSFGRGARPTGANLAVGRLNPSACDSQSRD